MTDVLEPTPEAVTQLLLDTFTDIHRLSNDLHQVEDAAARTRHEIGVAVASAYRNRRTADIESRKQIARKRAHLLQREGVAEVLRLGLEHYLSDEVEAIDARISEALQDRTIEATVHIGMNNLRPFDRRKGMDGQPRHESGEKVRGKFMGVSSTEGRIEVQHPIRGIIYGIQVIQFHRGLFRPIVDLDFSGLPNPTHVEHPKLTLVRQNSRSTTYA